MAEQTNFYTVQKGVPWSFKPVSDTRGSSIYTFTPTSTQTVGEGQRQFLDVPYVKHTFAVNSVLLNSMQKFITFIEKKEKAHFEVNTLFIWQFVWLCKFNFMM